MPVVGKPQHEVMMQKLKSYENDPLRPLAEQFTQIAQYALNENGLNVYTDLSTSLMHESVREAYRDMFVNDSYDANDPVYANNPYAIKEQEEMMGALFDNDLHAIQESAPIGSFNPVIGMALPMHKNLTQNCVFAQIVPKDVAQSPKFTLTMETRILVDTKGNEIDIFLEQNKIHDAIKESVPMKDVVIALPENNTVDIITTYFNGVGNLSIRTAITGLVVNAYIPAGQTYIDENGAEQNGTGANVNVILPINEMGFTPNYGEFDFTMVLPVPQVTYLTAAATSTTLSGTMMGYMKQNKFVINCTDAKVLKVVMHAVVDVSSAQYKTCYTKWSARTDIFQIPEAPHITTTVSPEEIKDINALYQVNQITKLMSIMNIAVRNWKDDEIHGFLDRSFLGLPESQKFTGAFDFVPPSNFLQDPITWRNTMFMDQLDMTVTSMLQVLNDPQMTISVIGRPGLISRITPTEYTYTSPSNIGPVELEYVKTVCTSNKRVYNFYSTDKMRNNNNLIILLIPRNTTRVMYKLFDYQFILSNEIRATDNVELPAMTCSERFLMIQYQPVQGRMNIVNPHGLREVLGTSDPIGVNAMNDYTANRNSYASGVNGAVVGASAPTNTTTNDGKW